MKKTPTQLNNELINANEQIKKLEIDVKDARHQVEFLRRIIEDQDKAMEFQQKQVKLLKEVRPFISTFIALNEQANQAMEKINEASYTPNRIVDAACKKV